MENEELDVSLEYTPTWIVSAVCFVIVSLSYCAERLLHRLGKFLERKGQHQLNQALQKLKEELMLLGFISLLLTVFQGLISRMCIPKDVAHFMLPCKRKAESSSGSEHYAQLHTNNRRRLLSELSDSMRCQRKGKAPLMSLEGLHQLHIFIFVLAVVHVIFCVTTVLLGGFRIRQWKVWEDSIKSEILSSQKGGNGTPVHDHHEIFKKRAGGYWRRAAVVSWTISFFKQFHGSVTKSDYIAMRQGFIKEHCPGRPDYDFHKYMMRALEADFKKIVSISWYLWLFIVVFLLLNIAGWYSYFWLSFLPLIMLLFVGAKLEHIISRLALEVVDKSGNENVVEMGRKDPEAARVKPSDKHFWFGRPSIMLHLIQFILFQNSFEIAFFFWILWTYGYSSCIMEKHLSYVITRLLMGVIVQVLCSYATLPLYAIVTQMGSSFKMSVFHEGVGTRIRDWVRHPGAKAKEKAGVGQLGTGGTQMHEMAREPPHILEQEVVAMEESIKPEITELPSEAQPPFPMS